MTGATGTANTETPAAIALLPTPSLITRSDGRLQLMTLDEVANTVSRADSISVAEERRLRSTACTFIALVGKELQFKQLAIATACCYLHNFFIRFSFRAYDRYEICAVCLFLAGKVEEQRRKVKDIAEICHYMRYKSRVNNEAQLKALCETILDRELLILSVIEFNFHPAHPYQYCMTILKKIFTTQESSRQLSNQIQRDIAQYAWYLINDSLTTTLCLTFKAEPIALSCIDATIRIMQLDEPSVTKFDLFADPDNWFVQFEPTIDRSTIRIIWDSILECISIDESALPTLAPEVNAPVDVKHVLWSKFRRIVYQERGQNDVPSSSKSVAGGDEIASLADSNESPPDPCKSPAASDISAPASDAPADIVSIIQTTIVESVHMQIGMMESPQQPDRKRVKIE